MKNDIVRKAALKDHGIIYDYMLINKDLTSPQYYHKIMLAESDRLVLTKYRCGAHFLKVITGVYSRVPIEQRLCKCKKVQTLHHIIFECRLTERIRNNIFPESIDAFFDNHPFAARKLRDIEGILKLRRY